jgi:hypothetical protein
MEITKREPRTTRDPSTSAMGILKGIYQYEEDSKSEFKDWATDVPGECFGYLFDEWKKRCNNIKDKKEMKNFISDACPNWAEWAK